MKEMLESVPTAAMSNVWGKEPRSFQLEDISTILEMHSLLGTPLLILLIQVTGSRKSTVPQTVGVVTCSVTLVIENILSLAADQQSKYAKASQNHGPVMAYQLDSMSDEADITALSNI